jgi:hypothetical protein
MKPEKIGVNPLNPRHPRSINPYTNLNATLYARKEGTSSGAAEEVITAPSHQAAPWLQNYRMSSG